jgi:protein-tyrosine-phosphatase
MKENILFVCRYNRFRSRIAAAYFKKNFTGFNVKSAGIIEGRPFGKVQKDVVRSFGLKISGRPRGLSSELLDWADKIVVVADDVPRAVFEDHKGSLKKLTILKVKDTTKDDYNRVRKVAKDTIDAVKNWGKSLKNL